MAIEGQQRLATEIASTSRGIHTNEHVSVWLSFQLLTSQQLSCNATVSNGSAMGNIMQHFERDLQYICGRVMESSTGSIGVVNEG